MYVLYFLGNHPVIGAQFMVVIGKTFRRLPREPQHVARGACQLDLLNVWASKYRLPVCAKCCSASNVDPTRSYKIKELACLSASNLRADQHIVRRTELESSGHQAYSRRVHPDTQ